VPEGDFRRPPQLWEQKIANLVAVNAVGSVSGGGTTEVGAELTPGDGGPPPDPDPIAPTPVAFLPPSTPTVAGTVQGIRVTWDGNNNAAEAYPPDAFVEVHVSTTSGFTPSSSTLRGRLLGPGMFSVFGLVAGTTYYARLVGVDAYGNTTSPSTQASSTTGLTTTGDYGTATIDAGAVSFNARTIGGITTTVGGTTPSSPVTGDIWLDSSSGAIIHKRWNGSAWVTQAWGSDSLSANCITAVQVAAGAITAGAIAAGSITTDKLDASAVTADKIAASTITGDKIAANTITANKLSVTYLTATDIGSGGSTTIDGGRITTGTIAAARIDVANLTAEKLTSGPFGSRRVVIGEVGTTDAVQFKGASTSNGWILAHNAIGNNLSLSSTYSGVTFQVLPSLDVSGGLTVTDSAVFMPGVYTNNTTGIDSVGITTGNRLRRISSSQAIKYDIATLTKPLSPSVDTAKVCDVVTVNPTALLDVAVVEFSVIDDGEPTDRRVLGFIAEDVADKLPIAVSRDANGNPAGVLDTSLLAALLAVVQDQQNTITDLTARVTALESA